MVNCKCYYFKFRIAFRNGSHQAEDCKATERGQRVLWHMLHESHQHYADFIVEEFNGWMNLVWNIWLAYTEPWLNPMKHLWDQLEQSLRARPSCPTSVPELRNSHRNIPKSCEAFPDEWNCYSREEDMLLMLAVYQPFACIFDRFKWIHHED